MKVEAQRQKEMFEHFLKKNQQQLSRGNRRFVGSRFLAQEMRNKHHCIVWILAA